MTLSALAEQYNAVWTEGRVPKGFWEDEENQRNAVKWLIRERGGLPGHRDYRENGLGYLMSRKDGGTLYKVLSWLDESDWGELEADVPGITREWLDYKAEKIFEQELPVEGIKDTRVAEFFRAVPKGDFKRIYRTFKEVYYREDTWFDGQGFMLTTRVLDRYLREGEFDELYDFLMAAEK